MKTPSNIVILAALIMILVGSSHRDNGMMIWNEDQRLTWDDFQGMPDYNISDVSALTSSGIIHYKGCENGKIIYKVMAYFQKDQSWVKPVAYTDYHLAHEQLHFDITELYARKLRQALAQRDFRCDEEAAFDSFVRDYLMMWQKAQIDYDLNTHHSMKPEQQQEWQHLVAFELSLYPHFRN